MQTVAGFVPVKFVLAGLDHFPKIVLERMHLFQCENFNSEDVIGLCAVFVAPTLVRAGSVRAFSHVHPLLRVGVRMTQRQNDTLRHFGTEGHFGTTTK